MWLLAYCTREGRGPDVTDFWSVHETKEEAQAALAKALESEADMYAWAIAKIREGSEPHYTRP